jgi:CxxC motif-containing protein
LTITGNSCNRGAAYAEEEIRAPKRVVTATCGIAFTTEELEARGLTAPRRVPVKTSAHCPKEKIPELLEDIYSLKLSLPVRAGHKLITDWKGLGIDVVAVRSLE